MASRLARIALRVPDQARALQLYAHVLGGRAHRTRDGDGVVDVAFQGDLHLTLLPTPADRAGLDHLLVTTDLDLDEVMGRATAAGMPGRRLDASLVLPATPALPARIVVVHDRDDAAPDGPAGDPPSVPGVPAGPRVDVVGLDHVCLATQDLATAVRQARDVLGGDVVFGGVNEEMGTISSQVGLGAAKVELLQPRHSEALLAAYVDRYGPGMHHLTFMVRDVDGARRAVLAAGYEVTGLDVGRRAHWEEVYLRPSATDGVLVQLAWTDLEHRRPLEDDEVAAVVAGRVDSFGYEMTPRS